MLNSPETDKYIQLNKVMLLKLSSGEEIVTYIRKYNTTLLEIVMPLQVNYIHDENTNSVNVNLSKWLPLTSQQIMSIKHDTVCTILQPNSQTLEAYTKTINQINEVEIRKQDKTTPIHPLYSWDHDGLLPN